MRRSRVAALAIPLLAVMTSASSGCSRDPEPTATSSAPVVEPVFPGLPTSDPPDAAAGPPAAPEWTTGLADVPVPVKIGKRAWAVTPVPGTELAQASVLTVGHVVGHRATLIDAHGQKVHDVPGALIHPLGSSDGLKVGDRALVFSTVTSAIVARVSRNHGGRVRVDYDWAGATRSMVPEHAQPLATEIGPMAFVGYPKFGRTSRGLLLALSAEQAWVQTTSGHVETHPRSKLEPLHLPSSGLAVGDAIEAYSWATGYERGEVVRVLEPELRFAVELPASRVEHPYFIADLRQAR